jgi:GNAT superfamily N-acetyltransferase
VSEIDVSIAGYVDAYVAGWARSRGAPQPRRISHGWHVATGTPSEPQRVILTTGAPDDVRRWRATLPLVGSCLKFAGARQDWLWLVDESWAENPLGWFMTTELASQTAAVSPDGLAVCSWYRDNVVRVQVMAGDTVVASGRAGIVGIWAVPDRIRTAETHRRRGLGTLVMQSVLREAAQHGARRAVLDASSQGRALYEALGWQHVAGQFGVTRTGP